jgi:hypothetical protein
VRACLAHREFAMASGQMTDAEFLALNKAWMAAGDNAFTRSRRTSYLGTYWTSLIAAGKGQHKIVY